MTPEMPFDESAPDRISRRKVLKRMGSGVAIAWTAPILTSIRTPAFAQPYGCDCRPFPCSQQPDLCDNGCLCTPHHGGGPCICWTSGFCQSGEPICETDADCPAGLLCGDIDPGCGCPGNVACFDPTGCTGSQRTRPIKGFSKR